MVFENLVVVDKALPCTSDDLAELLVLLLPT